jgi:hypothetical protein
MNEQSVESERAITPNLKSNSIALAALPLHGKNLANRNLFGSKVSSGTIQPTNQKTEILSLRL